MGPAELKQLPVACTRDAATLQDRRAELRRLGAPPELEELLRAEAPEGQ